ncbi:MAG: methylenetetrahydrofolate reductase [NAD(P)H] [Phycisphaeraceae bacterium]
MHIADVFAAHKATFSFEFFPPKDEQGWEGLFAAIRELEPLRPHYVSVTYGAGGSSREETHRLVERLKTETTLDPIPHLTCVCHSAEDIRLILERYAAVGVSNIMALGGDPPRWMSDYRKQDDHFQHAADLVRFIRAFDASQFNPNFRGRGFGIGVAGFPEGHPATPHRVLEMDYLKAKVDAGADYICTQLFFDNRDFYDFRDRCELAGIRVPIVAGLMPITSAGTFKRLPELALGARYPAKLTKRITKHGEDNAAIRQVGIDWATQQARDLLENNVAGIHFYTLNRSTATIEIFRRLGADNVGQLEQYVV